MTTLSETIKDMVDANVPPEKINEWSQNKINEMIEAEVPAEKITEAFGAVKYDRTEIKNYWKNISTDIEKDIEKDIGYARITDDMDVPDDNAGEKIQTFLLGDDKRYQFKPYFERAVGNSGINKIIKYHSDGQFGFEVDQPEPEGTGFLEKLTEGATGLVAELPTFIPGA